MGETNYSTYQLVQDFWTINSTRSYGSMSLVFDYMFLLTSAWWTEDSALSFMIIVVASQATKC